ncbi:DUF4129 domain-containing protein [Neobacillus drentensis]|uniref:DUF4129 domain-containing protein n=1 Tax=Neobacillus drentensis TaxID=220684 RepID=UPI002FFE4D28
MNDTDKARDDLEEILKTKEYTVYYDSKGIFATWWEQAKEWIAKQLEKLLPAVDSTSRASGPILIAVIVIVIILLALSAFLLLRNMQRNRSLRKQKPLQSRKEMNWTSQRHLEEAKKQEIIGEYSLSTRHLFLALLLSFHEKGLLEARIWKTNWDYFEELRKVDQSIADQFYQFALFFEEVTYGERTVQKEEYLQFHHEAGTVLGSMKEENQA